MQRNTNDTCVWFWNASANTVHYHSTEECFWSRQFRLAGASYSLSRYQQKVEAIRNFPQPNNHCKLCEFLSIVNFYHHYLHHCAQILQPLDALLSAPKDRAKKLTWSDKALTAFTEPLSGLFNRDSLYI